jgi:hypothetical protein
MAKATKRGRTEKAAEAGGSGRRASAKPTKKEQIISLFLSGMGEVEDIAIITGSRPSYVGSVLQEAGLASGYFDLYTSTAHPMNVYSKFFANKLSFRDEDAARESVALIDRLHAQFEFAGDRAGQHHALSMALVMFDRARWTGKGREAEIFREWLTARLTEADLTTDEETGDPEDADDADDTDGETLHEPTPEDVG